MSERVKGGVIRNFKYPNGVFRSLVISSFLTLLAGFLAQSADAQPRNVDTAFPNLDERIDAVINDARYKSASWGIQVVSLDTGKVVYAHDADKLFVPASVAKLYTAALALDTFGADHRIPTSLFATSKTAPNGDLRGDLILVGYGDPMLGFDSSVSWADTLAIELRKNGTSRVRGDLIGDATWFAAPLYGNGWEAGDLQSWFGVPASALSVDENIVKVEVEPGARAGAKARMGFSPPASAPETVNQLTTVSAPNRTDISLYRAPGDARLHAFGPVARDAGKQTFRLALHDPALIAVEQLRAALERQGIRVEGKSRSVYWPRQNDAFNSEKLVRIADIRSLPMSDIVKRGIKVSQNLYMQNLLLMVGAHAAEDERTAGVVPATFRSSETRGIEALYRYLKRIGVQTDGVLIEDGPGLSRRNLTSAASLTALLAHLGKDPNASAFRLALPEAGVDGSLTGRMRDTTAQGRVFAKTGSMAFTYSLAGYATTAAGERLAFTLMINNYQPPSGPARNVRRSADLDTIAILLAETSTRSAP